MATQPPTHPPIVRPDMRDDDQQRAAERLAVDEALPAELEHERIYTWDFLGVPGVSRVYELKFLPTDEPFPRTDSTPPREWWVEIAAHGWHVCNTSDWYLLGATARSIGVLSQRLARRLGECGIAVRVFHSDFDPRADGDAGSDLDPAADRRADVSTDSRSPAAWNWNDTGNRD